MAKILIAFFSLAGETYVNGHIENRPVGNTDTGKSLFFDHHDPETVKMFMGWR